MAGIGGFPAQRRTVAVAVSRSAGGSGAMSARWLLPVTS
jgi:hypothetical protein